MKTLIAHLSDSHFGTINAGVEDSLLSSLHEQKPDMILLTGDITQRARAGEYALAKSFLLKLAPTPLIAVPGNHDIPLFNLPARLFRPYSGFNRLFRDPNKGKPEKDLFKSGVQVIGLNSTSRWRHIQGDFNISRLERRLRETSHEGVEVRIAAFHHPMDCAKHVDEKNLLKKRNETMNILAKYSVDLVLGGHIHDPFVNLSSQRYPDQARQMILAVTGTCLSRRTRKNAPNSYNLIEVETGEGASFAAKPEIIVTRMDLRADGIFTPQEVHKFRREISMGWQRV